MRRVEAVTGTGALDWLSAREAALAEAAAELKTTPEELPARVARPDRGPPAASSANWSRPAQEAGLRRRGRRIRPKTVAGVTFAARALDGVPARELKGVADGLKQEIGSGVVAVVSNDDGKASLVVGVTDDLIGRISAVDLVRAGSAALGGKGGGGRPDMAQAGGPDGAAGEKALAAIEAALAASPAAA
ncbi:MAG: DHHA1 domain-containing protein [Thalassobaculum sp.]